MPSDGRFDLIVFDMDGTLVDTTDSITETVRSSLSERGHEAPPASAIYPLIGLSLDSIFRRFLPADHESGEVAVLVSEYRARYRREALALVKSFPDVTAVLGDLRARDYRLAVATGRVRAMAIDVLTAAGLSDRFDLVLGVDQVEHPKPAPDLALAALRSFGTPSRRALVVGDTVHDVEMGRGAGTSTCAVTYGAQGPAELADAAPDHIIDRFDDVAAIVYG
jgi:phosphoglycolate phosphatase